MTGLATGAPEPVQIDVHLREGTLASLADDVRSGLSRNPRELPPKYFYDARGSELFERICDLPEYYLTRTERAILSAHAAEIVAAVPEDVTLVELGSGSSAKTRLLSDALLARQARLR